MTPLVRRYIKTSFVFLRCGLALGAYIACLFVVNAWWRVRMPPAAPSAR